MTTNDGSGSGDGNGGGQDTGLVTDNGRKRDDILKKHRDSTNGGILGAGSIRRNSTRRNKERNAGLANGKLLQFPTKRPSEGSGPSE